MDPGTAEAIGPRQELLDRSVQQATPLRGTARGVDQLQHQRLPAWLPEVHVSLGVVAEADRDTVLVADLAATQGAPHSQWRDTRTAPRAPHLGEVDRAAKARPEHRHIGLAQWLEERGYLSRIFAQAALHDAPRRHRKILGQSAVKMRLVPCAIRLDVCHWVQSLANMPSRRHVHPLSLVGGLCSAAPHSEQLSPFGEVDQPIPIAIYHVHKLVHHLRLDPRKAEPAQPAVQLGAEQQPVPVSVKDAKGVCGVEALGCNQ